jgi:type IV fimbrial biogenesis protein FimT
MPSQTTHAPHRRFPGFTLVEVLIVLVIAAVLAAMAVPGFQESIRRNRLQAAAERLATSWSLARSEAIKLTQPVTISANGGPATNWSAGWVALGPVAGAGSAAVASAITQATAYPAPLQLNASAAAASGFAFDPSGRLSVAGIAPAPTLIFVFCADGSGLVNNSAAVTVSPSGRVRIAQRGTDGIPVKDDGTPVASCTVP